MANKIKATPTGKGRPKGRSYDQSKNVKDISLEEQIVIYRASDGKAFSLLKDYEEYEANKQRLEMAKPPKKIRSPRRPSLDLSFKEVKTNKKKEKAIEDEGRLEAAKLDFINNALGRMTRSRSMKPYEVAAEAKASRLEVTKAKKSNDKKPVYDFIELPMHINQHEIYTDKIKLGVKNRARDKNKKYIEVLIGSEIIAKFFSVPPQKVKVLYERELPRKVLVLKESQEGRHLSHHSKNLYGIGFTSSDFPDLKIMGRTEVKYEFYDGGLLIYLE